MFQPNGQAHIARRDAGRLLLRRRQLLMRGGSGMNCKRARIADIGDVIEKLQRVDEATASLEPALQFEADQTAVAARKIGVGAPAVLPALKTRKDDARNGGVF